jgi:hypothetical protein
MVWKKLTPSSAHDQTTVEKDLTPEMVNNPPSKQSVLCEKK